MTTPPDDAQSLREHLALRQSQGEAALLLVESLIHGLLARNSLSNSEAVDIVQSAIDVQIEVEDERGVAAETSFAIGFLSGIKATLQIDTRGKDIGC